MRRWEYGLLLEQRMQVRKLIVVGIDWDGDRFILVGKVLILFLFSFLINFVFLLVYNDKHGCKYLVK